MPAPANEADLSGCCKKPFHRACLTIFKKQGTNQRYCLPCFKDDYQSTKQPEAT